MVGHLDEAQGERAPFGQRSHGDGVGRAARHGHWAAAQVRKAAHTAIAPHQQSRGGDEDHRAEVHAAGALEGGRGRTALQIDLAMDELVEAVLGRHRHVFDAQVGPLHRGGHVGGDLAAQVDRVALRRPAIRTGRRERRRAGTPTEAQRTPRSRLCQSADEAVAGHRHRVRQRRGRGFLSAAGAMASSAAVQAATSAAGRASMLFTSPPSVSRPAGAPRARQAGPALHPRLRCRPVEVRLPTWRRRRWRCRCPGRWWPYGPCRGSGRCP